MSEFMHIKDIKITTRFRGFPGAIIEEDRLAAVNTELFDKKDLDDLEELAASIKEYGLLHPVVVDDDATLIAGMRRLCAHVLNGMVSVKVNTLGTLTELQRRTAELEENIRRVDLRWDDRLAHIAEIDRLKREEFGSAAIADKEDRGDGDEKWSQEKTAALVGLDRTAVTKAINLHKALQMVPELKLCKDAKEAQNKFDKMVETLATQELLKRIAEEEGTKDEKWLVQYVEDNYIIGDCIAGMAEMAGNNEGLILAEVDPPYGIDLKNKRQGEMRESYNEVSIEEYPGFILGVAKEVYRILAPNAWCIWWYGHEHQGMIYQTLSHVGFDVDKIPCAWVKNKGQVNQPDRYFARGWEPFYLCRKGKPVMHKQGRLNVFSYPGVPDKLRTHDTERPFELINELISTLCLPKSGQVLVPFLGSGNTIRAAMAHGMKAFGWDLNGEEQKLALTKKLLEDFEGVGEEESDGNHESS